MMDLGIIRVFRHSQGPISLTRAEVDTPGWDGKGWHVFFQNGSRWFHGAEGWRQVWGPLR